MSIDKRVAVVVGAGGDIGRAICRVIAETGVQIVAIDIDANRLNQCAGALINIGSRPLIIIADFSQKQDAERARDEVKNQFGRVDILINCQATLHNEMFLKLTEEGWRNTLSVHLEGTRYSMQVFAPMMVERKFGRIVNMSSIAVQGSIAGASYGAAKGAIEAISRVAALEWAKYGITANCVAPGPTKAGVFLTTPEYFQKAAVAGVPMKRAAEPEEIAYCIRYLASDEASFITGQTIYVDGGMSIYHGM